ncbi:MAG TPA: phosphatase PAP2 family protein [Gemmataceae bacterium]|jgi:undecaprenyl-diphosphatase|nr:phosphatase PAP2 family protein [Gemmataceae bacterium]
MQPDAAGHAGGRASLGRPLLTALLPILLFVGAFGVIAGNVVRPGRLGTLDRSVDEALQQHTETAATGKSFFKAVSKLGHSPTMGVLAGLAALVLLPAGQRVLAAVILLGLFANVPIDSGLKEWFQLERPPPPHGHVGRQSWGFPSGHALGSTVGYGLLGYVVVVFGCRRRWTRAAVVIALGVVVLLIGFSRMYLHAHYLSQVLGGFAAGAAWLVVCIAVLEELRRRLPVGAVQPGRPGWLLDGFALGGTVCLVAWLAIELVLGWFGRAVDLRWWADGLVFVAGGVLGLIASVIYVRGTRQAG